MRIRSITWASDVALLLEAAKNVGMDLKAAVASEFAGEDAAAQCREFLSDAEVILLHPSHEGPWDDIADSLDGSVPTVSFGRDPSNWVISNVPLDAVAAVNQYIVYGGLENGENMLKYLGKELLGLDLKYDPPEERLWQGIYHPDAPEAFESMEEYLAWRPPLHDHAVGLLFFRTYWANGDLDIVDAFVRLLEDEFDVIPAFCFGMGDKDLSAKSSGEVTEEFFLGRVDAVINLQSIFHAGNVDASRDVLRRLGVPVFHPLTVYHASEDEWRSDIHGMKSSEVGWSVAMPEFEGAIEPVIAAVATMGSIDGADFESHRPLDERVRRIVSRVGNWIRLRDKPVGERRVAFILHNNPCASVEASVGSAANLDSLESLTRIMNRMVDAGYSITNPPETGADLVKEILDRKAISEFRWTSVKEIVNKGGAIALMSGEDYEGWFETLPAEARRKVSDAWGDPPGEEKDGVPAAMVFDGKIVITGVRYGNVVVSVQPKRGCAGSRCDGQVCKILHDPEVPPPHQYLATYHYLEEVFGADVVVHVGTHGNLEFLPGKSVALSDGCYPDIAIGSTPHLYIYNSDNPPEGTIAKRRSYAVLVDHMQTVMTESGLYGQLKDLEEKISEYKRSKVSEKARAHATEHLILDLLEETKLSEEMRLESLLDRGASFDEIVDLAHEKISEIYNTQIPDGMHIFDDLPQGEKRAELIGSILRYDSEIRKFVSNLVGIDLSEAGVDDLMEIDAISKRLISAFLDGGDCVLATETVLGDRLRNQDEASIVAMRDRVCDLSERIEASKEMAALLSGFDGGYIEPGPSGLITRGKPEVLPTGRNFYSLDPSRVPTEGAWRVGKKLAEGVIEKYREEHSKIPENVAMFWMASDIMWADGEQLSQMMHFLGVEPVWKGGSVKGYRVIPLEELNRPRIDLTVRVSGITRDCFYNCVELLDEAIREVASLDESPEDNYVRKHVLESGDGPRIFASKPGTYGNGVKLAVYASAWKEEKDLSDVFIYWNGYAYGKGVFGEESADRLVSQLKSVEMTFNKTSTDEYDLLGCCCYFGTHGGLTIAAREVSGREVSAYYGDTRDRDRVAVRSLADEVRRVVRTKLLNPKWVEGMKRHGYKGAGDISKRVGRVYGWEATTREVDDWVFDEIARTFVLDDDMRHFFEEKNPWAMEEIGRRLLEASQRGLWDADPEVMEGLKAAYLEMEGWIEERLGDTGGDFQGGAVDVFTSGDVEAWRKKMSKVLEM